MARRRGDRSLREAERAEVRRRVAAGERIDDCGGRGWPLEAPCMYVVSPFGGIQPRAAVRSPLRLSVAEREEISRGISGGASVRRIAGASRPGTLDRVPRGQGLTAAGVRYRAVRAEDRASRSGPAARDLPSWLAIGACARRSSGSCSISGRPSRSPRDCGTIIPTSRRCGCPTRRSTSRCSCRAGVLCGPSCHRCLRTGRARRRPAGRGQVLSVRSGTWSCSASDRPRSRTGRCPGTGRAISSSAS